MRGSLVALALLAGLAAPARDPSAAIAPAARRDQRLHYTPHDRETGRYQYVPIAVPAGATRLTVGYSYDAAGGASAIDLGLFEPGPLDLGTPAFRGWSGGARTEVTLARSEATPGYWPGPLPAGEWHVMLGLYKVAPGGVDVTLTTQVSLEPEAARDATLGPPAPGPLRLGPAWYSGGLHLHTVHSDGGHTTAEVCRRAREAGLDFVVITDHNNTTHQLDAIDEPGLLRIVGEEVTTPGGHAGIWGLGGWRDDVDFRVMPGDPRVADLVRTANARGALFAINHPKASCPGCSWEHAIPDGVTAIEITDAGRTEQLAAIAMWDALLGQGRRIVGVGSSDWHRPDHPIDWASVRVWARELSQPAIFEGIRAGRVVVMADGRTPPPVLVARAGGTEAHVGDTLAVEKGGRVAIEVTAPDPLAGARVDLVWSGALAASAALERGRPARFERTVEADGYVRAHVTGADGSPVAVTNPVFLKVRGAP
jgi:hypothetical protein